MSDDVRSWHIRKFRDYVLEKVFVMMFGMSMMRSVFRSDESVFNGFWHRSNCDVGVREDAAAADTGEDEFWSFDDRNPRSINEQTTVSDEFCFVALSKAVVVVKSIVTFFDLSCEMAPPFEQRKSYFVQL